MPALAPVLALLAATGNLGTWKFWNSGNLQSQESLKMFLRITICRGPNVCRVLVSRNKHPLDVLLTIVDMDHKNTNKTCLFAYFPLWANRQPLLHSTLPPISIGFVQDLDEFTMALQQLHGPARSIDVARVGREARAGCLEASLQRASVRCTLSGIDFIYCSPE